MSVSSSRPNLVLGLNPALQRIISLPILQVDDVNRASSVTVGIGGKGQNVCVAARCMGVTAGTDRPMLAQFVGAGAEGDEVMHLLSPLTYDPSDANNVSIDTGEGEKDASEGRKKTKESNQLSVRVGARCRTCITLVDSALGQSTEIIEPSGDILPHEIKGLLRAVRETFPSSAGAYGEEEEEEGEEAARTSGTRGNASEVKRSLQQGGKLKNRQEEGDYMSNNKNNNNNENNNEINNSNNSKSKSEENMSRKCWGVAVMGSMPPACPSDLYARILRASCDSQSKVILDTAVGTTAALAACLHPSIGATTLLKVNARELCKLAGITTNNNNTETTDTADTAEGGISMKLLRAAANSLAARAISTETAVEKEEKEQQGVGASAAWLSSNREKGRLYVAVTDGPHPASFFSLRSGRAWRISSPSFDTLNQGMHPPSPSATGSAPLSLSVRNPIGAGDAVASGTLHFWTRKLDPSILSCSPLSFPLSSNQLLLQQPQLVVENEEVKTEKTREMDRSEDRLDREEEEREVLLSFCWGVACGTASCASELNSDFDLSLARTIYQHLQIQDVVL